MPNTARAHWEGDLKSGKGTVALGSGAFEGPYSFKCRFEGEPGTTPEELPGAAHASCSRWRCRSASRRPGIPPPAWTPTPWSRWGKWGSRSRSLASTSRSTGVVPGLSASEFQRLAEDAKTNCIISHAIPTCQ